jgi:hypothetical protein
MNQNQLRLYRFEWSNTRTALRALGWPASEVEAKRKQIHAAAGAGTEEHPKSSLDLNNKELDGVLAMFRAISRPADLGAQLHQLQQPYLRWRFLADDLLDRISGVLKESGREHQAVWPGPGREGYLLALAKRLGQRDNLLGIENATEVERWKILSALMVRFDQVTAATATQGNQGRPGATRPGKPARRRPFDEPMPAGLSSVRHAPATLPAIIKPVVLEELDHDDPF